MLNHLAVECSLLSAKCRNLKAGIKLAFPSKIEISDRGDGLN